MARRGYPPTERNDLFVGLPPVLPRVRSSTAYDAATDGSGPLNRHEGARTGELLREEISRCVGELLAARPYEAGRGWTALDLDEELPRRGVRVRALYHHAVRAHEPAAEHARAATDSGAELRTVDRLPGFVIIVDRRVAFLLQPDHSSSLIRDPCTVDYFCRVFDHLWAEGWAFPARRGAGGGADAGTDAGAADPKPAILRLLSTGMKDETVARRLGMSVRTTRRHIADIMAGVDAQSRFQAGVLVARHGLLRPRPPSGALEAAPDPR